MFKKPKVTFLKPKPDNTDNAEPDTANTLSKESLQADMQLVKELSARYASLFMICYRRKDVSGMHIALTAFTHTLHALKLWPAKDAIRELTEKYIVHDGFPESESGNLVWLLNHYFELPNEEDETTLLSWYESIDDEWVLRKKLREMFPEKANSELTQLIAEEIKKEGESRDG